MSVSPCNLRSYATNTAQISADGPYDHIPRLSSTSMPPIQKGDTAQISADGPYPSTIEYNLL